LEENRGLDQEADVIVLSLFAAGKAGCASVHGTNRLGANSLLDLVIFERVAAHRTAEVFTTGQAQKKLHPDAGEESIARLDKLRFSKGSLPTSQIKLNMRRPCRSTALCSESSLCSSKAAARLKKSAVTLKTLENRKERRRAHARDDFQERYDDNYEAHFDLA
jgi:succinate dehydrogenase/fumarate reductase flavoprotein subunit